jgi:peptidoglycan/xylan/chitin deacetylase (PgdA/CDA1 family)
MSAKTLLRSGLIHTAAALRVDEIALGLQRTCVRHGASPVMHVIEMHETPEKDEQHLRRQLEWVAQRFTLVDLDTFGRLWREYRIDSGSWKKPPVLFTFDDGRLNNYTVAARVLESFGARGVFFVVPEFVQCRGEESRRFYYSRIDTRESPPDLPDDETRSMTAENIADLARRGHSVGSHTYSHANLASLPESQLQHEIVASAEQIAGWTGQAVDAFAWTFSWDSITPGAWKLIQRHHRYCFAPCPGSVDCRADSPGLIWRTEVETAYSAADYRFMYAGLADPLWRGKRERLKTMLKAD